MSSYADNYSLIDDMLRRFKSVNQQEPPSEDLYWPFIEAMLPFRRDRYFYLFRDDIGCVVYRGQTGEINCRYAFEDALEPEPIHFMFWRLDGGLQIYGSPLTEQGIQSCIDRYHTFYPDTLF